jgi:hypothetical protein
MEEETMAVPVARFEQLVQDVALIREILIASRTDDEGELTDWAKKELAKARAEPDSELISSEEAKQMILAQ